MSAPVEVEPRKGPAVESEDTLALHAAFRSDPATKAVAVPIYQTTAYELDGDLQSIADVYNARRDGFTYTRIINPTTRVLEKRFARIDGGVDSLAVASGQAANFIALINLHDGRPGANVVTTPYLYGNTWNLLHRTFRRLGIEARVADPQDPSSFESRIDDNTLCLFGESFSNPILEPLPIGTLSKIGARHGVPLVVDNTTTPLVCSPSRQGAAITTYSATKYVCGHGTTVGGLVVDSGSFPFEKAGDRFPLLCGPDDAHGGIEWSEATGLLDDLGQSALLLKARMTCVRDFGPCMSPFNAFQLIQGIETLPLRMKRHCENARFIAEALVDHPGIERVVYPSLFAGRMRETVEALVDPRYGYGAMLMFEVAGGERAGRRLLENAELMYHVSNVGDARTLITHPVSTTHRTLPRREREAVGIFDGSIRLCVGIEDPRDILDDLERGLEAV